MRKILNTDEFLRVDALTTEREHITVTELMERAAQAFVNRYTVYYSASRPVVVFAGSGNNGGDALAISRLLAQRSYVVELFFFQAGHTPSPACADNLERLKGTTVKVHEITSEFRPPQLTADHVVIDGLFGTGLSRPLTGGFAAVVRYINASAATVVSVDIPSGMPTEGLDDDRPVTVVRASRTFTFHAPCPAFFMPDSAVLAGDVEVLDIGAAEPAEAAMPVPMHWTETADIRALWHNRNPWSHKGDYGHALLMAGWQMRGAVALAATACLRSGVGKLTVCTDRHAVLPPEAIMVDDIPPLDTFDAIAVGPGLGLDDETADSVFSLLHSATVPLLLDADALSLIAQNGWQKHIPAGSVITPHPGEMRRLVGESVSDRDLLQRARELASECHLNIALKGHRTAVIDTEGNVWFNPTGNAGMATAGAGDTLTGIVLALLAQHYTPQTALRIGVWAHGKAGDIAAQELGQTALIASDITAHLAGAFLTLERQTTEDTHPNYIQL